MPAIFSKLTGTFSRSTAKGSYKRGKSPLGFDVDSASSSATKGIRREDFHVIKLLGKGGCGSVTLAEHMPSGKRVALKSINCDAMSDRSTVKSAFVEKDALLRLAGESQVLKLLGCGLDTKTLYIATEAHRGTYADEIKEYGTLDVERAKYRFAEQVRPFFHWHMHSEINPNFCCRSLLLRSAIRMVLSIAISKPPIFSSTSTTDLCTRTARERLYLT